MNQTGIDAGAPARLRRGIGSRRALAFAVLFGGMTFAADPGLAEAASEAFGPGKVSCQQLGAGQFDCLLTSLRVNAPGNDVATFSLAILPAAERAAFQKWCSTAADDCTVQIQGARQTPGGSRLSAVTSVRWTRLEPPRDQAVARAFGN